MDNSPRGPWSLWFVLCLVLSIHTQPALLWQLEGTPRELDHKVNLPTKRPLIIGHRGSSGVLPEHTVEAYKLAVEQGADVIECDVVMTKDLNLMCYHDNYIKDATNVAQVFPDRLRTYFVPDEKKNITDYFTVDFTLDELKSLRVKQRFGFRDQKFNGLYQIPTLEEYIQVAKGASRPVGIYPETKQPNWVNSLPIITNANVTFEELLVGVLTKHGYTKKEDPCFVQSFSQESLAALKNLTQLPLVYLIRSLDAIPDDAGLQEWSKIYYGIGLAKGLIVQVGNDNRISTVTDFLERAHRYGLKVHLYTFRNENQFLAWDYGQDPYEEMKKFYDLGIDGYFTDFSLSCSNFLNVTYSQGDSTSNGVGPSYGIGIALLVCLFYAIVIGGKYVH